MPVLYAVYCSDDERSQLEQAEWIIKGIDGQLYLVASEPGGWLKRADYQGVIGKLVPLSQKDARSICWMVYGDVGQITMEGANLEPFSHIWNGSHPYEPES